MRTWIKVVLSLFLGCRLAFAAEEAKVDVKLLLSPSERAQFESPIWTFKLVRKGFPISITENSEKENRLFYRDSNPQLDQREVVAFTGVRLGQYTLLAETRMPLGSAEFAFAEVDVRGNRAIALNVPPIFSIKVVLQGEEAVNENATFSLRMTDADHCGRYYYHEIPMGVKNDEIVGKWGFLLVPRKYKLVIVKFRGGATWEKDLGTIDVTANDVMDGTLTLDAKKHPWR